MFGGRYRRAGISMSGRRYGVLLFFSLVLIGWLTPRLAVDAQHVDDEKPLEFDIPAQPLSSALKAYSARVQLRLFYDSSLMEGRQAPPVHGTMSARAALYALLDGTGLSTTSLQAGTVTILSTVPRDGRVDVKLATMKSKVDQFASYFAGLQADIRSALCRSPSTQVDDEARIIRLWIAPSGAVVRAELFSSGGGRSKDDAYAAAIRTLVVEEPRPANLPQPITMMVLPRNSQAAAECDRVAAAGSATP